MSLEPSIWNFEQDPANQRGDETTVNLRAYLDRMDDTKIQQYSSAWTNEQVMEWDGNFRDDGELMMFCSEREVEIDEYRRELENCIAYRNRVRESLLNTHTVNS